MNIKKYGAVLACMLILVALTTFSGCFSADGDGSIKTASTLMISVKESLSDIDWNNDHPGSIKAKLTGCQTNMNSAMDILNSIEISDEEQMQRVYAMKVMGQGYLDFISAGMDIADVIEHYNNAKSAANIYDFDKWDHEIMLANSAIDSACNMLYIAGYRLDQVDPDKISIEMRGALSDMRTKTSYLNLIVDRLNTELKKAIA